jgi:hypothetical protein
MKSINLIKLRKHLAISNIRLLFNTNYKLFSTNHTNFFYPNEKVKIKTVSESSDWSEKENFDSEWEEGRSKSQKKNQKEILIKNDSKLHERENIYSNSSTDPNDFSLNSILEDDELINEIIYKQSNPVTERNFKSIFY